MLFTNAIVTGYCICALCCGKRAKGITAAGIKPRQGVTIAAPRSVRLGTKVYWNGKMFTAQDRTAKRVDGRFDVYFRRHSDAVRFGIKRNQTVRIEL